MGKAFRFLHCADLHIGSAFSGLSRRIPELDGILSQAPFLAWHNTVAAAIEEKVDFLLIAGDSFDRSAPSLQGRIEFKKGLDQLDAAGIPVFISSGNHDPWPSAWSESVRLPENVTFFRPGEAKSCPFVKDGEVAATIAGVGHASLSDLENLAVQTGEALKDASGYRIACVHANLCGDRHAAPASLPELVALPVDYWALGHVHHRRVLHEKPYVVYSGCTQGKDIHEPGPQGCFIVDCDGFGGTVMTFRQTSVLEFEVIEINISALNHVDELINCVAEKTAEVKKKNDLLFRLKLKGCTPFDAELRRWNPDELRQTISEGLSRHAKGYFLEEIVLLTRPPRSSEDELLPESELDAAAAELADEKFLETLYEEMRSVHRDLPVIRQERFEELRKEGSALLAELLTGKLELK